VADDRHVRDAVAAVSVVVVIQKVSLDFFSAQSFIHFTFLLYRFSSEK